MTLNKAATVVAPSNDQRQRYTVGPDVASMVFGETDCV